MGSSHREKVSVNNEKRLCNRTCPTTVWAILWVVSTSFCSYARGYSTAAFQDAVFRRHWHTREMPGLWGSLWLGSEAPILLGPLCCWGLVVYLIRAFAKLLQSCPSLCDPMDHSLPGSSVHGILQARILEWAAMPSSRGSSWPRDGSCVSYLHWLAGSLPLAPPGKSVYLIHEDKILPIWFMRVYTHTHTHTHTHG